MSETFCQFLNNGLVYNNNTENFTVSPCCYFSTNYEINPSEDLAQQLEKYQKEWNKSDVSKTCKLCIDMEKSGIHSYRQASFENIADDKNRITMLTVAVTKQCNLACPSCDPASSSFWFQENKRNKISQPISIEKLHQSDKLKQNTQKFIDLLVQQDLSALEYIKFGGGEPLMNDTHLSVLDLIPNPSQVTLQYTSNFSIMPSRQIVDTWKKFKLVKWVASLDGVESQFEFLRWPYRWAELQSFVERAKLLMPGNVMFGVEHTINPLNVYYYDLFERWVSQHLANNASGDESDFNLHPCHGVMSLAVTPPAVREMVQNKLGTTHPVMGLLNQNPYCPESMQALVQYLDKLNAWRGVNWRELFPDVEKHYG